MAKTLLVVGNDKIGRRLLSLLEQHNDLLVVLDRSVDFGRVIKLLRRGSLNYWILAKMLLAEFRRCDFNVPLYRSVRSSRELIEVACKLEVDKIYLFRAGIIINKDGIGSGIDIQNIHCANIVDYGGVGAIARALKNLAFEQQATLHRITNRIDEGEIIGVEPYTLNSRLNYGQNEDIAYDAGIRLLLRELKKIEKG